jgi:hypothetical protein
MKNIELECIPSWRYCRVRAGEKKPYPNDWQVNPLTLDQVDSSNIGLLLGPASNGTCAIDFDGFSAWHWWDQHIGIEIPDTVTWSSGRPGRCQMAFSVPSEYWPHLKRKQITLDPIPNTDKFEGFEFRWTGGQSVIPPSLHPDTQQEYFWVRSPLDTDLSPIPEAVLCRWLELCYPEPEYIEPVEYPKSTEQEVVALAEELKKLYPALDYDTWIRVTWAFCHEIGTTDGINLMRYYYPESQAGEYDQLRTRNKPARPCTIGTVKHLIKQRRPTIEQQADQIDNRIQELGKKLSKWQQKA